MHIGIWEKVGWLLCQSRGFGAICCRIFWKNKGGFSAMVLLEHWGLSQLSFLLIQSCKFEPFRLVFGMRYVRQLDQLSPGSLMFPGLHLSHLTRKTKPRCVCGRWGGVGGESVSTGHTWEGCPHMWGGQSTTRGNSFLLPTTPGQTLNSAPQPRPQELFPAESSQGPHVWFWVFKT